MNDEQAAAAKENMIEWLADPHELGKKPRRIARAGDFVYNGMRYYIFKYKRGFFGKWLLGVSGGYEGDELEPCGHTFSEMQEYDPETARANCVAMIEMIMNYWKQRAAEYERRRRSQR